MKSYCCLTLSFIPQMPIFMPVNCASPPSPPLLMTTGTKFQTLLLHVCQNLINRDQGDGVGMGGKKEKKKSDTMLSSCRRETHLHELADNNMRRVGIWVICKMFPNTHLMYITDFERQPQQLHGILFLYVFTANHTHKQVWLQLSSPIFLWS